MYVRGGYQPFQCNTYINGVRCEEEVYKKQLCKEHYDHLPNKEFRFHFS